MPILSAGGADAQRSMRIVAQLDDATRSAANLLCVCICRSILLLQSNSIYRKAKVALETLRPITRALRKALDVRVHKNPLCFI